MKIALAYLAAMLLASAATAAIPPPPPAAAECTPAGGLNFICGLQNPEDLVHLSGTPWIVASAAAPGAGLWLIDSQRNQAQDFYPGAAPRDTPDGVHTDCAAAPNARTWITHGLNLRGTGRKQYLLYVVAHGERESIEVFSIDARPATPAISWRGCVLLPEGLAANSVASLRDGTLLATILLLPGKTFADSVARRPTGAVYQWQPGRPGFRAIAGMSLPGNNGIETSANGREIFVVSSGLQTIVAFSNSNPARQLRTSAPLPITPDNVHRGPDGRLFTAGMKNDVPECGGAPGPTHDLARLATCPRGTIAIALDPATLRQRILLETPAIPHFSNATMVLPVADRYWVGSFGSDRVSYAAR